MKPMPERVEFMTLINALHFWLYGQYRVRQSYFSAATVKIADLLGEDL